MYNLPITKYNLFTYNLPITIYKVQYVHLPITIYRVQSDDKLYLVNGKL